MKKTFALLPSFPSPDQPPLMSMRWLEDKDCTRVCNPCTAFHNSFSEFVLM